MALIHHWGSARAHCAKRNYCCTLCGLFLYCNKISQKCFLSFLMQLRGNQWTVIMQHSVPICASCQSLTTLGGKANWRKLHFFQGIMWLWPAHPFNMDVIMAWCTVYSFLRCFSFIVWHNNNGLISETTALVIITLAVWIRLQDCLWQARNSIALYSFCFLFSHIYSLYLFQKAEKNLRSGLEHNIYDAACV